ncbi:MFS transporter permease [Microbacterium sp. NPDC055903]
MWVRQAFFRWLFPAAFVLPLWLLIGWGVFNAGGWAFLGTIFIAIPSVFLGQLVLTLLVRSRPSVRVSRAVSWWDVAGFGLWHALTITVGFYPQAWFGLALTGAIIAALALFWLSLWQLWSEARGAGGIRVETAAWNTRIDEEAQPERSGASEVFIIQEKPSSER